MKSLSRTRLLVLLAVGCSLLCMTGCLEEKETVTVYPSGAGTIHVYQKMGEQLSGMITGFAPSPDKKAEFVESQFYKELAKWQGVTAWSPVRGVIENGRVVYEATGYFDNIAQVKKTEADNVQSFTWTPSPDGGSKLVWNGGQTQKEQRLEDVTDEQQQQVDQIIEMFKGLRIERVAVLPGAVQTCGGCTEHKDRVASFVITGNDVTKLLQMQKDYRVRITAKQITSEKANAEFTEKTKMFKPDLQITAAPGTVTGEFDQFKKDYEKAKTDSAAAGTAKKIQQAGGL